MASTLSRVPSARFCWQQLARDLAPVGGELALDVACSTFTNRHLFHTRTYYGLDLFPAQLQAGLDRYADDNSIGVVADIGRPLPFKACADVCVSTYTLLYVPPVQRLTVTQHLVDSVRRGGCLILQCPNVSGADAILSRLREQFRRLEVTYSHSPFSRYYSRRRPRHWGHNRMTTPASPSVWTPVW